MPLLVGNEIPFLEGEGHHHIEWGAGVPGACEFAAEETSVLNELSFVTGDTPSTCTSLVLGIFADEAGRPAANALAEGIYTGIPGIKATVKVSGLSASITEGTKYWLAWLAVGGAIDMITATHTGGTTLIENGGGKATLTGVSWGGTAAVGPATIYGTGSGEPEPEPEPAAEPTRIDVTSRTLATISAATANTTHIEPTSRPATSITVTEST